MENLETIIKSVYPVSDALYAELKRALKREVVKKEAMVTTARRGFQ